MKKIQVINFKIQLEQWSSFSPFFSASKKYIKIYIYLKAIVDANIEYVFVQQILNEYFFFY